MKKCKNSLNTSQVDYYPARNKGMSVTLNQATKIKLENRYAAIWSSYESNCARIWVRGTVFANGKFYRDKNLPSLLSRVAQLIDRKTPDELNTFLNQLNGFFAIVVEKGQNILAIVDRVRSIPLFYCQAEGKVFLSDDAEWIRKNARLTKMDPMARQEFLFTGYVTGQETLFSHMYQLQAGEMLHITQYAKAPCLKTNRYYRFLHTEPSCPIDEESLLAELDAISTKCVERLIEYADGKQIVVPLSAGRDSRLIVTLLRRLKYDNVLTFSYGLPGNYESKISKKIAESLDYTWEFIPYSRKLWREWWNSKERIDYLWWASNWTSLPHAQDWPATWQLKESGKLGEKNVISPGHTGDFVSGGHIPLESVTENVKAKSELYHSIMARHYCINSCNNTDSRNVKMWFDRLENRAENEIITSSKDLANWYEKWEWQERQAKFIINSVRVYEFWGYDWYLPLWDRDFMLFWQKTSLSLRINKVFYDKFVDSVYAEQRKDLNDELIVQEPRDLKDNESINDNPTKRYLKSLLARHRKIIKKLALPAIIFKRYIKEPLGYYGRYSIREYVKFSIQGYSSIRMLAYTVIREMTENIRNEK